jgi:NADPH:quinone reductase-like Zn-dependent oxidoreductase
MKQILQTAFGKPAEVVSLVDMEYEPPNAGEVIVAVQASPINPADLLRLTGKHAYAAQLPSVPGIEGAGIIQEVGADVTDVRAGDTVLLPFGGCWTQIYRTSAQSVVPLPDGIDLLQAAMLGVNPVTAAGLLTAFGDLQPGDWVIQNAANSAAGKLIVKFAATRKLRTANIVRRETVAAELVALGADVVLVGDDDLARRAAAATGGAPIMLGLDAIAGESSGKLLACLAEGGTLVVYGLLSGQPVQLPAAPMVFFDYTIRGYSRLRMLHKMGREQMNKVFAWLAAMVLRGELYTPVEGVYPVGQIRNALDHAEQAGRDGKILLTF